MSKDDSDASERLSSLNWSTAFVVNLEKLQESASVVSNSRNRKLVYGISSMNFVFFCSFNVHAISNYLRIHVIKTSSEDPCFGIEPCMCYDFYVIISSNFFLLFFSHITTVLVLGFFFSKSKLSTNVLETNIEGGSLFSLKYHKTNSWIIDCFNTIKYCALIITSRAKTVLCRIADRDKSLIVCLNRAVLRTAPTCEEIYILELIFIQQSRMCKVP